jgi:hypothetical protein
VADFAHTSDGFSMATDIGFIALTRGTHGDILVYGGPEVRILVSGPDNLIQTLVGFGIRASYDFLILGIEVGGGRSYVDLTPSTTRFVELSFGAEVINDVDFRIGLRAALVGRVNELQLRTGSSAGFRIVLRL